MITIPDKLCRQIAAAAERDYPNETCGFILGRLSENDRIALAVLPTANAREAEETYHRYEISPIDFLKAERTATTRELDVIGIYHSHPDHPAAPSEYDSEHSLPYYSYVIVSVTEGRANKLTSWRLENDRSRFDEEMLVVEED